MIEIIPAIDIIEGKCVRLTQGDYGSKKIYNENPLEVAKQFEDCGMRRLHVVDLDGARSGHIVNHRVLERLATKTSLVIDFGGGIKSEEDALIAFNSGAEMITGGSIAVREPEIFNSWLSSFGNERIILGADARNGTIAVSGWEESAELELIPFVKSWSDRGVTKIISTDISVDGMLKGASVDMYKEIRRAVPSIYLIASGGVGAMADIEALAEADIPAVIVGKAIYEGRITTVELTRFVKENY